MKTTNIMIVGVGGQGTLLASRILGNAVIGEGYDVKVSEVHGMSQRGGSVVTYVKFGEKVYSPIIGRQDTSSSSDNCSNTKFRYSLPDAIRSPPVRVFFAV